MTHSPNTKKFIGGYIGFVREQLKLERNDVVSELTLSYQNLWDIENGYRGVSCETFDQLIQSLELTEIQFWSYMPQYLKYLEKNAEANKLQTTNHKQ